jgi:hypothetical protein
MKKYLSFLIAVLLGIPALLYGQSDLVEVMTPNAMIIFDTSSSMNSRADGTYPNPSGVEVDKDGNKKPDGTAPWTLYNFEGGGNHPDSKLYQAKLALKKVITDLVDINLGFSTYAQFKTDAMVGRYVRDRKNWTWTTPPVPPTPPTATTCTWRKLYWRWNPKTDSYNSTSTSPLGDFKDVWGNPQTSMAVGSKLYKHNHTFTVKTVPPHPPNTYLADLEFTITNIVLNAEMNYYTYYYTSAPYDVYETWNFTVTKNTPAPNCGSIVFNCDTEFPPTQGGGWRTYDSTLTKYPEDNSPIVPGNKWNCFCAGCTAGSPGSPGSPGVGSFGPLFQEFGWVGSPGTSCLDPTGSPQNPSLTPGTNYWSAWRYVDSCYDNSSYTYPSDGSKNYPHTWSYFHMQGGIWPLSIQFDPFYPSQDDKGVINDTPGTFDNHYFFINIPQVDDSTKGYPIKNAILAMLDLTPVQNPQTLNWWTKLPLKPNSLTSNTSGLPVNQTPIADSLYMAKRYFDDYINKYNGGDAPSKAKCRGNYVILLTDGLESCRYLDPPTNLKPDFDMGTTASKDLFNIGVNTFVIGFGKDVGGNTAALNSIARAGSNDKYDAFFTDTLGGLTSAIQTIFQIIGGSYGRSSPVVSRGRDRLYRGYFNLPGYEGHLVAYDLKTDGSIITPETWDAGKVMNSTGRGPVSTWVDGNFGKSKGDFTDVDLADKGGKKLETYLNPLGEDINNDGKVNKKDSQTIDGFTLNANYDDGKNGPGYYKGIRSAKWLLGDIYHSTPLVVDVPNFNFPDAAFSQKYSDFKTTWKSRETVIYAGANDGMVHAFSDKDGKEKFGIIPNNLLGKLKELRTNGHQFFVDSSPRAYDVFIAGSWSTVLVSGERGGGNGYFALDVTDPKDANYPIVLWDVTDPGMGDTWSRPDIGWVRISGQEKFVAFVGGGYSTTDGVGNTFYVIDIADGSILRRFIVGAPSNKVPAGATAFDSDLDGRVNGVYFGDLNGVLWKIKIDGEEDISKWQLISLYTPSTSSPVFYPPAVTKNNQGKILVYYGQGNESNIFVTDNNSFFEIWDNNDVGKLMWETDGKNGRPQLEPGEKVLAAPVLANNVVYFTTWKYTGDKTDCGAGVGRLYGLTSTTQNMEGGLGALLLDPLTGNSLLDKDGKPLQMGKGQSYFDITDYFPESKGIPSSPVVTPGVIYISTSLNAGKSPPADPWKIPGWGAGKLKYWREKF